MYAGGPSRIQSGPIEDPGIRDSRGCPVIHAKPDEVVHDAAPRQPAFSVRIPVQFRFIQGV